MYVLQGHTAPPFYHVSADSRSQAPPSRRSKDLLHSDATYILVGGTGGLGRSIARWMAGKGAQNIVLVSRSASLTGKVKELTEDLYAGSERSCPPLQCGQRD